jgi:hypothetical protein
MYRYLNWICNVLYSYHSIMDCMCVLVNSHFAKNPSMWSWLTPVILWWGCYSRRLRHHHGGARRRQRRKRPTQSKRGQISNTSRNKSSYHKEWPKLYLLTACTSWAPTAVIIRWGGGDPPPQPEPSSQGPFPRSSSWAISLAIMLKHRERKRRGRALLFLRGEDYEKARWENRCPVLCNLYQQSDKATTICQQLTRSCVVVQKSRTVS